MLGVPLADNASHALSLDDLAVLTNRLHAAPNFHGIPRRAIVDGVSRTGMTRSAGLPMCSSRAMHPGRSKQETQRIPRTREAKWPADRPTMSCPRRRASHQRNGQDPHPNGLMGGRQGHPPVPLVGDVKPTPLELMRAPQRARPRARPSTRSARPAPPRCRGPGSASASAGPGRRRRGSRAARRTARTDRPRP